MDGINWYSEPGPWPIILTVVYVPAALLDYKFSLLHEKGELVNSMYIRKADFLKEDLHAYDNDIGYGDI